MNKQNTDRYVTYKDIDCAGNSKRLMVLLRRHIDNPDRSNLFWEKFKTMLVRIGATVEPGERQIDELFLIHTYINNLYEIFEAYDDSEALVLLDKIERECC